MKRIDVTLPPIRDDDAGYTYLCRLVEAVTSNPEHTYIFNFSKCSTIAHNGLVVIGGLCNFLQQQEKPSLGFSLSNFLAVRPKKVGFEFSSINSNLLSKLKKIGFLNYVEPDLGDPNRSPDYIGYREHEIIQDDSEIVNHLRDSWLTSEKLKISEELKHAIISKIYEIYVNAYGHGLKENASCLSVISCGSYEPKEKTLCLSVLDLGCGIVKTVQKHMGIEKSLQAFEWALETGNSTRTDSAKDLPRGLGFGILKEFAHINQGKLTICSDHFMASVNKDGEYSIEHMPSCLSGTLVSISINCDDRYYRFTNEVSNSETYF